jgi:exodeoxyribonuclease (lambda-induced)
VGRITGSRVPKILGLSPHGGRAEVMREMVREHFGDEPDFAGNWITAYGESHESQAISEYELTKGRVVEHTGLEQLTVVHPAVDWAAATLDGTVEDIGLVEIKCPWRAVYTSWEQRPDIEVQMRWQLECSQREWCDLAIWYPSGLIPPSRVRYREDWLPSVVDQLEEFMADYLAIIGDGELAAPYRAPLVDQRTDSGWIGAASWYQECKATVEAAERELDEAKAQLVSLADGARSTRGGGLLLTRSEPKGSVPYAAMVKERFTSDEIESRRGEPRGEPTWTVRNSSK